MLTVIMAGFLLGFAGSLHCVGMCGPLSMALPTYHLPAVTRFFYLLAYQAGRVITYSGLGLLFGLAGHRLYLAGWQQGFSIVLGVLILLAAVLYFIQRHSVRFSFFQGFYRRVQLIIGILLKRKAGPFGFLALGMANGLLPCGMVYIALATTLSLSTISQSIIFMAMFGAGTLPAMMLVACGARLLRPRLRSGFRQLVPVFITLTGVILILRGLNLGIAFISPALPHAAGQPIVCPH